MTLSGQAIQLWRDAERDGVCRLMLHDWLSEVAPAQMPRCDHWDRYGYVCRACAWVWILKARAVGVL